MVNDIEDDLLNALRTLLPLAEAHVAGAAPVTINSELDHAKLDIARATIAAAEQKRKSPRRKLVQINETARRDPGIDGCLLIAAAVIYAQLQLRPEDINIAQAHRSAVEQAENLLNLIQDPERTK